MRNNLVLKIKGLKTYFYTYEGVVKALDGIDLEIRRGEVLGLVGETGCGKSVTALSILRLIPDPGKIIEGEILFKGENLLKKSEEEMRNIRGSEISMIFQEPTVSLNPVFKVGNQISEAIMLHQELSGASNAKEKKRMALERTIQHLNNVGISDPEKIVNSYPHELSGGMCQRVMIAMALACRPSLLIADEPSTALDNTIQAQILDLLKELIPKYNASVLLITHDLGVIAETSDSCAVMYAGNVVEYGDITTIFKNRKHPYTTGLMEAIPKIDKMQKRLSIINGSVPNLINPPSGCRFHPRCPHAMEICKKEKPILKEVGNGHKVACFLY
jgi:oligopeptide/dipeptide ABC transporter ATP-binding protein